MEMGLAEVCWGACGGVMESSASGTVEGAHTVYVDGGCWEMWSWFYVYPKLKFYN